MCCSSKRRCGPPASSEPRAMFAYPACASGISYPRRRCGGGDGNGNGNGIGVHAGGPGLIRSLIGAYKERKAVQHPAQQQQCQPPVQSVEGPHATQFQASNGPPQEGLARRLSSAEETGHVSGEVVYGDDAESMIGEERPPPRYDEVMKS